MNVRRERVIQEMEAKAEKTALRWFQKNYEKVYRNPQLNPEQVPKNAARLYNEIIASRKRLFQWKKEIEDKARRDRKPQKKDREVPKYCSEELSRGPMYPVPEEVFRVLFSGVSHNDEGQRKYLKLRYSVPPEDRYYDPPTSALEYGWDIKNRAFKANKEHARSAIVKKSFYRRTGSLENDDPLRRLPYTSGHVSIDIL